MAILDEKMTASILERVAGNSDREKWETLARENPWYPLPWLMLAETDEQKQKAALWFKNEHRIHWLLRNSEVQQDEWLQEQLTTHSTTAEEGENPIAPAEPVTKNEVITPEDLEQQAPQEAENQQAESEINQTAVESFEPLPVVEEALDISLNEKELVEDLESNKAEGEVSPPDTEETETLKATEADVTDSNPEDGKKQKESVNESEATGGMTATPEVASNKPAKAGSEEKLLFEPLFATDYFASQGIKIDLNAVPQTNFDRQVKTFTQWLKTMKRIAPETNLPADPLVDAQASASVEGKDVVTEAMAQVLEKQGKYQKAIEILAKLILLHPEKSAFFAAQIEKLKALQ